MCLKIDINYLKLIINITGFPSESLLNQINVDARDYLQTLDVKPQRANFYEYFSSIKSNAGKKIKIKFNYKQLYFIFYIQIKPLI